MRKVRSGGGWAAIGYTLRKARQAGGIWKLWRAMRTKNACKTCALGMGGQRGGMVNESGGFPEVCKKSLQAMVADLQGAISEEFWRTYSIAQLRRFSPQQLEHCGRLVQPVVYHRGENYFQPATWEQAIEEISSELRRLSPQESFWYFSGRSSNEAGFLLQLLARVYGTNNVNNCSYYCHQASGVGLSSSIGSGTATVTLEDLEHADLVFLIGGNPASNHPRLMSSLRNVRRRGGDVVVVNPVVEAGLVRFRIPSDPISLLFGTKIASQYVQLHIGGDLALLTGVAKRVVELNGHDGGFLHEHCDGADAWLKELESLSWEEIHRKSGVAIDVVDRIARRYIVSKNTVFSWTMGITHHVHGVENVQAIVNLACARGMLGRPRAGLLPIRGHSNVQGIGSVGVTPKLKDAILENLQQNFGLQLPTEPGLDTLGCMEAAHAEQVKFGFCLGGNLYGSNPDAQFAEQSLSRLKNLVYLNTTLNTGHAFGLAERTWILPVLARDEEPQATTQESMFNFVRLSDGGPARLTGPRSEVALIAELGKRVVGDVGGVDWDALSRTESIRQWIGKVVPGFGAIAEIGTTKREFTIGGRIMHQPRFPTGSGRARLHRHTLPELAGEPGQLRLMTVRSEGQFNTVVYEEEDLYRGQERRDVILLHPDDLQQLGIVHNQPVDVVSATGRLSGILARAYPEILPGNALMYYPEANVLVARHADPMSRTPAFKNVVVTVSAQPSPHSP